MPLILAFDIFLTSHQVHPALPAVMVLVDTPVSMVRPDLKALLARQDTTA